VCKTPYKKNGGLKLPTYYNFSAIRGICLKEAVPCIMSKQLPLATLNKMAAAFTNSGAQNHSELDGLNTLQVKL
jgi:hypothetical protein